MLFIAIEIRIEVVLCGNLDITLPALHQIVINKACNFNMFKYHISKCSTALSYQHADFHEHRALPYII